MTSRESREGGEAGQAAPYADDFVATPAQLADLLQLMIGAATNAARYIRARAQDVASIAWERKAPSDFVSDVDTGAEAQIHEVLDARPASWPVSVPVHFLGEESSPEAALGPGLTFVVDPLDGTTNFLHGYPWYAVSIGALLDGELIAAVVLNAPTGELFTATRGGGAHRDGAPIAVSTIDEPARALLGTGLPFKYHEHIEPYVRTLPDIMRATAGVRRAGSASLDLCDVACGRFDAFWELSLAPWDVAAGMLIIREAGGLVTDLAGHPARVGNGPVVAGNPAMHQWLLNTLKEEL